MKEQFGNKMNMKRKKLNLVTVLAFIYILFLIWLILFKLSTPSEIMTMEHRRSINMIPFHYDVETSAHFEEVIYNILVFVPFAVYLKMLGMSSKKAIFTGFVFSLMFELIQYMIGIGSSDVTDLIGNTAGTLLGVGAYWALFAIFKNKEKLDRVISIIALVCTILIGSLIALLILANLH